MSQTPGPVLVPAPAPVQGTASHYYKSKWMGLRPRRSLACSVDAVGLDKIIDWLRGYLLTGLSNPPQSTVHVVAYNESGAKVDADSGTDLATKLTPSERIYNLVVTLLVRTPTARRKIRVTCTIAATTYRVNGDDADWVRTAYGQVAALVTGYKATRASLRTPGLILGALGLSGLSFVGGLIYAFFLGNKPGHSHALTILIPSVAGFITGYAALGYVWLALKFAPPPLIIHQGQHGRWQRRDTAMALCAVGLLVLLIVVILLPDPARADGIAAISAIAAIVGVIASWYAFRATQGHP